MCYLRQCWQRNHDATELWLPLIPTSQQNRTPCAHRSRLLHLLRIPTAAYVGTPSNKTPAVHSAAQDISHADTASYLSDVSQVLCQFIHGQVALVEGAYKLTMPKIKFDKYMPRKTAHLRAVRCFVSFSRWGSARGTCHRPTV